MSSFEKRRDELFRWERPFSDGSRFSMDQGFGCICVFPGSVPNKHSLVADPTVSTIQLHKGGLESSRHQRVMT